MGNKCECGRGYYKTPYTRCFKCNMEAKGQKLCPVCGVGYYDPNKYEKCYDCNNNSKNQGNLENFFVDKPKADPKHLVQNIMNWVEGKATKSVYMAFLKEFKEEIVELGWSDLL